MTSPNRTTLPDGIVPYAQSPRFTAATLPEKLKATHDLKAGTWGRLNVLSGTVTYFTEGNTAGIPITIGQSFVIAPQEKHHISVTDDAELFIEFCARPKPSHPPASSPCSAHENDMNDNGYMDWAKAHSE